MAVIEYDGRKYKIADDIAKSLVNGVAFNDGNPYWHEGEIRSGDEYYSIDDIEELGNLGASNYAEYNCENQLLEGAGMVKNAEYAKQQWLRETLNRKLARFSYDNGYEGDGKGYYGITYERHDNVETYGVAVLVCSVCCNATFKTLDAAQLAIEEVVKPFVAEHPDFKPWM